MGRFSFLNRYNRKLEKFFASTTKTGDAQGAEASLTIYEVGMQVWGSDGDIRPMLALGRDLKASGHEVSIVVTSVDDKDYSDLCHALGLNYLRVPPRLGVDIDNLMRKTGSSDRFVSHFHIPSKSHRFSVRDSCPR